MSRHDRQNFLGANSEEILKSVRIGLVGVGGGGSHANQQLAHLGVGHLFAVDFDRIEETNLNRLVGATVGDVNAMALKVDIARRVFLGVNPAAAYQVAVARWQEVRSDLAQCDIIIGGLDSYVQRSELEAFCRGLMIPYIDMGMDVHALDVGFSISGQTILSMPGGPCLWCVGYLNDQRLREEAANYGDAGGKPQVVWPNGVLASLAVGLVVKLLTPWRQGPGQVGAYLEFDADIQTVCSSNRFMAVSAVPCRHYPADQVGDPLFDLRAKPCSVEVLERAAKVGEAPLRPRRQVLGRLFGWLRR